VSKGAFHGNDIKGKSFKVRAHRGSSGSKQFARISGRLGAPKGKRYAIIIGSNYEGSSAPDGQIPPLIPPFDIQLYFAENDAETMYGLLKLGYGFTEVIPLFGDNANRTNIMNTIEYVKDLEERGDEVVFFYSGHGAQKTKAIKGRTNKRWKNKDDNNCLVPRGRRVTNEGIVTDEGDGNDVDFIWDNELARAFRKFDTNNIVFIFDMCLAGGMTEVAGRGRIVCMATTKNGIAAEIDVVYIPDEAGNLVPVEINHGLLTALLLMALTGQEHQLGLPSGYADTYDHLPGVPDVTIEEAFNFASAMLIEFSPLIEGYLGSLAELWGTPLINDRYRKDMLLYSLP